MPWLHVIMYVGDDFYSGSAFRQAHSAGVRKVLPDHSSPLDLLQELVSIHNEFRKEGRVREGRVVFVTHAKGGTGATTIAAGLGEVCSAKKKKTLLWDLDVETRDLCLGLMVNGSESKIVSSWVNGSREVTRDSLTDALVPLSQDVSVLMPPDSMAEAMDLVCHTDGILIATRVLEIARVMHDVVIIDSGGRIGPAAGALMRAADEVVIVIDDTTLGLTALDLYLNYVKALVVDTNKLSFIINGFTGTLLAVPQIQSELEIIHNLGEKPWRLPPVPFDSKGNAWPGSGRSIYALSQKSTRAAFEHISYELGLTKKGGSESESRKSGFWERLLGWKEPDKTPAQDM